MIRSDPITANRSDPVPHVHGNFEITKNIDNEFNVLSNSEKENIRKIRERGKILIFEMKFGLRAGISFPS